MIKENVSKSFVTAIITGDRETVRMGIAKYLKDYPFQGYGTRVIQEPVQAGAIDGDFQWRAEMSRYASCD